MNALAFPKPVRLEDDDYRRFINRQPCCISGVRSQAHHVIPKGWGKTGSKVSDYRCIPLSEALHKEYHRIGRQKFEERYNIELDLVQIQYLEMYISALREGENLGAKQQ